jgi:DoxX-like family
MSESRREMAIVALRGTVGIVVLLESVHFTLFVASGHHVPKIGLPQSFWVALGAGEAVAALLFLVPATRRIGAYALLVIFGIAMVVHVLHGQFGVGDLVVYAMAVIVGMTSESGVASGDSP